MTRGSETWLTSLLLPVFIRFSLSQWLLIHVQVHTVACKSHVIASSVAWCRFLPEQILVQSPHSDVTEACDDTCHLIRKFNVQLLFDVGTPVTLEEDLHFCLYLISTRFHVCVCVCVCVCVYYV